MSPFALRLALAVFALLLLGGCGGSAGLSSSEKAKASDEFAVALSTMDEHLAEDSDLPPALEESARQALLKQDSQELIALTRRWADRGMSDEEVLRPLTDAVSKLQELCSPCVATLDRERETYG